MDTVRPDLAAIIVAGGRSERMGTDKLALSIDGATLLERAIAACAPTDQVIIAGPPRPLAPGTRPVIFVSEEPPLGGPAAGIAAAVTHLGPQHRAVVVLAADLAHPDLVVDRLLDSGVDLSTEIDGTAEIDPDADLAPGAGPVDGVALVDSEGFTQHLAACYRASALLAALGSPYSPGTRHSPDTTRPPAATPCEDRLPTLGHLRNVGVRQALRPLRLTLLPAPEAETADLDTPAQARRFGAEAPACHD